MWQTQTWSQCTNNPLTFDTLPPARTLCDEYFLFVCVLHRQHALTGPLFNARQMLRYSSFHLCSQAASKHPFTYEFTHKTASGGLSFKESDVMMPIDRQDFGMNDCTSLYLMSPGCCTYSPRQSSGGRELMLKCSSSNVALPPSQQRRERGRGN